jgi:hypothetical protein
VINASQFTKNPGDKQFKNRALLVKRNRRPVFALLKKRQAVGNLLISAVSVPLWRPNFRLTIERVLGIFYQKNSGAARIAIVKG